MPNQREIDEAIKLLRDIVDPDLNRINGDVEDMVLQALEYLGYKDNNDS